MIIYQGADNYFMYVMIMELRSSDNNHCVASAYGLFPDGNSYRYMTIPIHFINNKFNRMVDKMRNANIRPGCKIFIKASMHDQKIYVNQFLFQGQMKFYKDEKHNHHHLICEKCGKIIETKEDLLDGIEELIREQYKFNVSDHDIKFFGICEDCQKI